MPGIWIQAIYTEYTLFPLRIFDSDHYIRFSRLCPICETTLSPQSTNVNIDKYDWMVEMKQGFDRQLVNGIYVTRRFLGN